MRGELFAAAATTNSPPHDFLWTLLRRAAAAAAQRRIAALLPHQHKGFAALAFGNAVRLHQSEIAASAGLGADVAHNVVIECTLSPLVGHTAGERRALEELSDERFVAALLRGEDLIHAERIHGVVQRRIAAHAIVDGPVANLLDRIALPVDALSEAVDEAHWRGDDNQRHHHRHQRSSIHLHCRLVDGVVRERELTLGGWSNKGFFGVEGNFFRGVGEATFDWLVG
jgi:hypothetical protein